jgi:hypothetical protein
MLVLKGLYDKLHEYVALIQGLAFDQLHLQWGGRVVCCSICLSNTETYICKQIISHQALVMIYKQYVSLQITILAM